VSGIRQEEAQKLIDNFDRVHVSYKREQVKTAINKENIPDISSGPASRFTAVHQCRQPQWSDYQCGAQHLGAVY
jgi:hypothetical protein